MVVEISTFGSCASRNIFNTHINEDYKKFFRINFSVETVSFISLMSDPIQYYDSLINSSDNYDNSCVISDLSKNFLNFLKTNSIEYLIIDTYFDVFYSLIVIDENKFISDSPRLRRTKFYESIKDKRRINVIKDFDEYYALFKKSVDLFFEFIKDTCPNTKVILNCCRAVFKYEDDGIIIDDENLKKSAGLNKYRDIFDGYILKNYDIDVLNFDGNTLADKNHIFGLHEINYEPEYYKKKILQLNEIIERNNNLNYYHKSNVEFRESQRKNLILKFNTASAGLPIASDAGVCNVSAKHANASADNGGTDNKLSIAACDVVMVYKDGSSYDVQLVDGDGNPVAKANEIIKITIPGKTYRRVTDAKGVASLSINLGVGVYNVLAQYENELINNTISIYKWLIAADDVSMVYKDGSSFNVRFIDSEGNPVAKAKEVIKITIRGKTYSCVTDANGVASLPIGLGVGAYKVSSQYGNRIINNYIFIKDSL